MTAQELNTYINKVLGNSIRCLLPSYWWKRLLTQIVEYVSNLETEKQDVLISGTSIKTINGVSILGSGDIEILSESGGITEIKMNGSSKGTSGVVDLGTVLTSHLDISGKLDKTEASNTYVTKQEFILNIDPYNTDGIYAVTQDGDLVSYDRADESCMGVALVKGEHKFMIAKSDATDGTNNDFYWGKNLYSKDVAGITNISSGADYIGEGKKYGTDFTTWSTGPVVDFNGAANTAAIIAGYTEHGVSMNARDMCTVLNTFNASDGYNDWYIPACGQLALMYLAKTDINAALAKIGGTAFESNSYWSSSEYDADTAWLGYFDSGLVNNRYKDNDYRVRFVRDISVKPLKERVSELESSKQDKLVSGTSIKTINGESILGSGDIVIEGGSSSGGGITVETDPIFSASPAAGINDDDITNWNSKTSNIGTITGITMNGVSKGTSGVVDLGTVLTSHLDISGKLDKTEASNTYVTKQELSEQNLYKPLIVLNSNKAHLLPNKYYRVTTTYHSSLTVTLEPESNPNILNEYLIEFAIGSSSMTISLPDGIKWVNGETPLFFTDTTYLISIVNNLGIVTSFK